MTNWDKLHATFVNNICVAMYEVLAKELGVTIDSLIRLEVGWAPVVLFKKGKLGQGFWTSPMRDGMGRLIGISLRSRDGDKLVYPGSEPGCVYPINPNHNKGGGRYVHGAHNWDRTADIQELCPVCGKPDGCLIAKNKAAVMCRVVKSDRPVANAHPASWLHVLSEAGKLNQEALLDGDDLVLVVEGLSDTAVALDLGYTGIGRPSNLGGQEYTSQLCQGRSVVIVGENDQKKDGSWPGRDGASAVFTTIRTRTRQVKMLFPPAKPPTKDLRVWRTRDGLTREQFDVYLEKNGEENISEMVLPNGDPITVAKTFLKDVYTRARKRHLRRWAGAWYGYKRQQGRYRSTAEDEIHADFYQWADGRSFLTEGKKETEAARLVVTTAMIANMLSALSSTTLLKDVEELPMWIAPATGPDAKDLVVFSNGMLDITDPEEALRESTPDFFNTTALPFPWNSVAACPQWLSFLQSSLGDEPEKISLLQEWMGYCLTPDTSRHKMMYFRGESGSGKGTVLRVMQGLVGASQSASTSMSQLAESFGLQPLMGKLICTIGDARLSRGTDAMRGLEVLLGLTGGDAQQVNRKFKDQIEGAFLSARVTIASNDFMDVPDFDGAMLRRLNIIQFARSFRDHPDIQLTEKLLTELEGIAVWALEGLKRLRQQGKFTVPASSVLARKEWERDTNPICSWLEDCTEAGPNFITPKDMLFDCWAGWAKDTRRASSWNRTLFLRRFATNASGVVESGACYKGIGLRPGVARKYLGGV